MYKNKYIPVPYASEDVFLAYHPASWANAVCYRNATFAEFANAVVPDVCPSHDVVEAFASYLASCVRFHNVLHAWSFKYQVWYSMSGQEALFVDCSNIADWLYNS